jgi:hypothetical protein
MGNERISGNELYMEYDGSGILRLEQLLRCSESFQAVRVGLASSSEVSKRSALATTYGYSLF